MSQTDSNELDTATVRRTLLLLIDSISSGGTSETFGETTLYLDSLSELRSMWFDDLYHGSESLIRDRIFGSEEARVLDHFSVAFRNAYPEKSDPEETNINELQDDPSWQAVVSAAREARAKLRQMGSIRF
jgi:hypothetical protein